MRTPNELIREPACGAASLGRAIPESPHAVSVALPQWEDVIGYEEKDPRVWGRVRTGYPRFVTHPFVNELGGRFGGGRPCLPFPTARVAEACRAYVAGRAGTEVQVVEQDGLFGVVTTDQGAEALRAFWQHTGTGLSSRRAEAAIEGRGAGEAGAEARGRLRALLAEWYGCAPDDVYLHASGMGSLYDALSTVTRLRPGLRTAQLGFPYVDSLKLQQEFGSGALFLHELDERLPARLAAALEEAPLSGCFCEIPGNPMLGCPDLRALADLLHRHDVPLVVDDTIATPYNVDLRGHADLVVTSLTKFIAGSGDVMGGALICLPGSPRYARLKEALAAVHEDLLWDDDAVVLEEQARDFPDRMRRHNEAGLYLAERLRGHPAIERVWYPRWENAEAYEAVRRPGRGWGALLAFLPRRAAETAPRVYDALPVSKGPSLGTVYTLACPFTLLAHYTELDWAESLGVSRYLIRISVGLEDPAELWSRLEPAIARAAG